MMEGVVGGGVIGVDVIEAVGVVETTTDCGGRCC